MKINNKIAFTGAIILMLISFSCNEDFLDKNPLDQLSSETFWKSKTDVDMAVTGCYAHLKGSFFDYRRGYLDALSENALAYWGYFGLENMALGNITPTSAGAKDDIYKSCYSGIAQFNFVIDNIDKATIVNESILNVAKGEVRFLRALFYFDLVNCFGDVPLYKTLPLNVEASKIAKSPKADVLKFIYEDLDFAISNLPDALYTSGHAVKGSAMALKTRVLLTEEKWSEAAALSKQIISPGKFSLYPDYESMFIKKGQKNNPEIMFACEYQSPDSYQSYYGMNIEYAKHLFLTPDLENAFECTDGLSISESPLYNPEDHFANRDPRHTYIVRNPVGTDWEGSYPYDFYNITGVQNRKYVDPTIPGNTTNAYLEDWNFILIRYADVLLMYAEAQNEASGPDQSVYDAINQVRARPSVNMPPIDQSKYNTKELIREFIRHERQIEFAVEGIRYFDLKRWKIAHVVLSKRVNYAGYPYLFEMKHYYWPFPQPELDANPNLVQTTGY